MSLPLSRRTVSAYRNLLIATGLGMIVWGAVLPLIYSAFGQQIGAFAQGNPLFEQFSRFGGGDLFTLHGTIALGFVHPFTLLIMGIVAIGYPAQAIAGERAKGTLEILLAHVEHHFREFARRRAIALGELFHQRRIRRQPKPGIVLCPFCVYIQLDSCISPRQCGIGEMAPAALPETTFFLDRSGGIGLQAQIRESVVSAVLARQAVAGARMPSTRRLAQYLGVSRITVTLAYQELAAQGYLEVNSRSGYRVAGNPPAVHLQSSAFVPSEISNAEPIFRTLASASAGVPERPRIWSRFHAVVTTVMPAAASVSSAPIEWS